MKKIVCELHMFSLNQNIYVIDDDGTHEIAVPANMEELPEIISALCHSKNIDKVMLTGNSVFGAAVAEDILAYSKQQYKENNIEVEVVK